MTGGQHSPTTCYGDSASTMPYGNIDRTFDIVQLALGAGASFVARTTTYHVTEMIELLEKAITHKGFALVEILSQCPTYYGRRNNLGSAVDMLNHFRKHTVTVNDKRKEPASIKRGIFRMEEYPEFCAEYKKLMQKLAQSQEDIR
jgi:2-oxoglutarate ferredoxin oxidoreductase subunit beta